MNVRKEAGLLNTETGADLELDIYLPSLNLAFEYQVRVHYICFFFALIIFICFSYFCLYLSFIVFVFCFV